MSRLVENKQRGDMTFVEKALAIREAQQRLEAESGNTLSHSELAKALRKQGFRVSPELINLMFQALDYLLPNIPTLLYAGMGKHQIEEALKLRRAAFDVVKQTQPDADEETYNLRFAAALQPFEEEGAWDYDAFSKALAHEIWAWNTDYIMRTSAPPPLLIPAEQWADFCTWARDGGYDQSWFNRWDSKSLELQKMYLEEMSENAGEQQ